MNVTTSTIAAGERLRHEAAESNRPNLEVRIAIGHDPEQRVDELEQRPIPFAERLERDGVFLEQRDQHRLLGGRTHQCTVAQSAAVREG